MSNYAEVALCDQGASISSGSFHTDGMIVVPCSMKRLTAIRCGYATLTGWQLGAIKGEVDLGKTLIMEPRPGLRFGWRTDQLERGKGEIRVGGNDDE